MTRSVGILGVGHYVPEKIITNADMEKIVETSDQWITERTGIKQRHIAAPEEATSDLAYNAAMEALKDAGVAPEELDLVIVGTGSPWCKKCSCLRPGCWLQRLCLQPGSSKPDG